MKNEEPLKAYRVKDSIYLLGEHGIWKATDRAKEIREIRRQLRLAKSSIKKAQDILCKLEQE